MCDIKAGDFVKHYNSGYVYKVFEVIHDVHSPKYGDGALRCWLWKNGECNGRVRHLALTSAIRIEVEHELSE